MTIRSATQNDAVALATLLQTLGNDLPRLAGEPFEVARARVSSALKAKTDTTLLVAEVDGKVSGFVHTHWQPSLLHSGGEGFIAALFVHPECRGQGIGQALLEEVQEEAERRGSSRLSLLNMRHRPSYERGFYAKLGWEERPYAANFFLDLKGRAG